MDTQPPVQRKRGGNKAALFVYAMEGLENMAFVANAVSLVTYFFGYMNFSLTESATTLTNFLGTAFLLALVGGFICDTYISRFKTCVLFAFMELLTVVLKVAMSCQGCAGAVNRALGKLEGVESFVIYLKEQKVTVKGYVEPETVLQTVSKTGKKIALWEEEAKVALAEPENKPLDSEAEAENKPLESAAVSEAEPENNKPSGTTAVAVAEQENKPSETAPVVA